MHQGVLGLQDHTSLTEGACSKFSTWDGWIGSVSSPLCLDQFFCHSLSSVGVCVCVNSLQHTSAWLFCYKGFAVLATVLYVLSFLPPLYSESFCLISLTPLVISSSLSLLSRKEKLFIFLKKVYGLGGKDLAPCRALRGRSKKENNPVFLAFPGYPRHPYW